MHAPSFVSKLTCSLRSQAQRHWHFFSQPVDAAPMHSVATKARVESSALLSTFANLALIGDVYKKAETITPEAGS